MTIALSVLAALLLLLSVSVFIKIQKGAVKALLPALCALMLVLCGILLYFSGCYRAADDAKALLPEAKLELNGLSRAWFFDGPGEDAALVFYPGAKVEAAAYAPLMKRLADGGLDCFLVEMPLHFALFDIGAASKVTEAYEYPSWFLAGHSLGAVAASMYAAEHPDKAAGLVLLASYPNREPGDLPLLSTYGDRDGVLNRKSYEKSRSLWPEDAEELVIPGGNHAGFGNYGPQRGDGEAAISPDEQQKQTAEAILSWVQTHIAEGNEAA